MKFFSKNLIIGVLFLMSFFIFKNVKAVDSVYYLKSDYVDSSNSNGWTVINNTYSKTFDIDNSCSNPLVILNGLLALDSLTFNNVSVSNFTLASSSPLKCVNGANWGCIKSHYFIPEELNSSYEISFYFDIGGYSEFSFSYSVFCNVDPEEPIIYYKDGTSSWSTDTVYYENSLWYFYGMTATSSMPYIIDIGYTGNNNFTPTSAYDNTLTSTYSYSINSNTGYESPSSIAILNYKAGSGGGIFNINILENPLNVNKNDNKTFNFSYNFCDNYSSISYATFGLGELREDENGQWIDNLVYSPSISLRDINISPQACSGVKSFTIDKRDIQYFDNENINWVWYVEGEDSNEDYFFETYPLNYTFFGNNWLESGVVSPLKINLETYIGSTTIIAFNYDFTGLDWEESEVCLNNVSSQYTTGYCVDIMTEKGFGLITIPLPNAPLNLHTYFQSSISNILKSQSFYLEFFDNSFWVNPPFIKPSNYDLACSEEEWNTPDPVFGIDWLSATTSIPAFNFTKLKCKTILGFYDLVDNTESRISSTLNWFVEQIKTVFPFNIPAKIVESWNNSKNKDLPANLGFLQQFDENRNIKLDLSPLTGSTTDEIIVFGPDIIENNAWTETVAGIREFFKYFFWAFFIFFAVYKRGERVYYRLKEEI